MRRQDVLVRSKTIQSTFSHLIEYFFKKWQPEPLVKPSMIRGRVFTIVFIVFQSGLTSLCFVDDLYQILGMFSLNSIGYVTKCGPAGI